MLARKAAFRTTYLGKKNQKVGNDNPIYKTEKEAQMYRTELWTLWEKVRVG